MRRRTILLALPLCLAAACAAGYYSGWLSAARPASAGEPAFEHDPLVRLGAVRMGKIVAAPLRLRNPGPVPLSVDGWRADCSCVQVYSVDGEIKQQFAARPLAPGEEVLYFADVRSSGDVGLLARHSVVLATSAGEVPFAVEYTPVAAVYPFPAAVDFGVLRRGATQTRQVEIKSDGLPPEPLGPVEVTSARFRGRFMPAPERGGAASGPPANNQYVLGTLELTTDERLGPQHNSEEVVLSAGGKELVRVPVSAFVEEAVSVTPGAIVLPRTVNGNRVYSQALLVRAAEGERLAVAIDPGEPAPFALEAKDAGGATQRVVVTCTDPAAEPAPRNVRLRVTVDGNVRTVVVPVFLTHD